MIERRGWEYSFVPVKTSRWTLEWFKALHVSLEALISFSIYATPHPHPLGYIMK